MSAGDQAPWIGYVVTVLCTLWSSSSMRLRLRAKAPAPRKGAREWMVLGLVDSLRCSLYTDTSIENPLRLLSPASQHSLPSRSSSHLGARPPRPLDRLLTCLPPNNLFRCPTRHSAIKLQSYSTFRRSTYIPTGRRPPSPSHPKASLGAPSFLLRRLTLSRRHGAAGKPHLRSNQRCRY